MTDMELADELEKLKKATADYGYAEPRLLVRESLADQIISALRRVPQRPLSGEMVMVPREPTRAMLDALNKWAQCEGYIEEGYRAMLSAVEAEGRKS